MEGRVRKPSEQVDGPLWPHVERIVADLEAQGYARNSINAQMWLVARLSRWLNSEGLAPRDLTARELDRFEKRRWERGGSSRKTSLAPVLRYLRNAGELPEPEKAPHISSAEELIQRYRDHLVMERGVARTTVVKYEYVARLFLRRQTSTAGELVLPDGKAVTEFIADAAKECGVGATRNRVKGLRSLLQYMHLEGIIDNLVDAVPTVADWRDSRLPKAPDPEHLARLLASCRDTVAGRRDHAILVLLARLGLRAGEVAALKMEDFDWVHGEVEVHSKGGRRDRLPLPYEVGEAVVAYILNGRPASPTGPLFHRVQAPLGALSVHAVKEVVRRACRRAGIPSMGPHRLRHGLATQVLAAGASLIEVGQALRHRDLSTTAVYAKVDRARLRDLARPWPGVLA